MSRRTTLGYYRAAIPRTSERSNVTLNFIRVPYIQRCEFDPKGLRYRPNSAELPNACRSGRVAKHQCACHIGSNLLEQFSPFSTHTVFETQEAGDIAAWVRHALYEASTNWVWNVHEYNRDGTSGLLQRRNGHAARAYDYIRCERDQFCRVATKIFEIASNVSSFNLKIATNLPSQLLKGLGKDFASCFRLWVVSPKDLKYSNDACALGRLCIRCNWPGRRPAKDAQKFPSPHRRPRVFTSIVPIRTCSLEGANVRFGSKADIRSAQRHVRFTPESDIKCDIWKCPLRANNGRSPRYSITWSARASKAGGIVRLSALAVLRLTTSSYFVGACTGRSAGFSPFRIRST